MKNCRDGRPNGRIYKNITLHSEVLAGQQPSIPSVAKSACASAVLAAALLIGGTSVDYARADNGTTFNEIETKYIFGFTEGSGVGLEGEKEFSVDTVGTFGKRDGRYTRAQTKLEFEYTPNQYLQIEFGALTSYHSISGVTGLDDINKGNFTGLFGEVRYMLLERSASSPLAVTLSVEPNWRAFDETSGTRVVNYELETKINADVELIPNRLFMGFNLIYEPETTRAEFGTWEKESTFGATIALAYRPVPQALVGVELDYYRHYDGLAFNTYTGDALYLGPTLFTRFSPKTFMSAAWGYQIAGHEVGESSTLNLAEFSRHRAKLKFAVEF
ncbi:MAG TPA: hypothetical protein VHN11_16680 [Xanthobacteraceae bacterium]|nr:hypothetical protein [Xanthobacteraceae bacterium]